MKKLRLEVFTKMDRNQALGAINDAINTAEGWVVTHQLFSNKAASICFEMPSDRATAFVDLLEKAGLKPHVEGGLPSSDGGDCRGFLSVTFLHSDPDLKRDVPAFG